MSLTPLVRRSLGSDFGTPGAVGGDPTVTKQMPTPTTTARDDTSPVKHAEEWWGGWSEQWSWHEPASWDGWGWGWGSERWSQQDWGGSWGSMQGSPKQSRSPKKPKTPKKSSPKPAPHDAMEQSEQARAMLQRPLTSILENTQVDQQAADVQDELEKIMDDSSDELALRSMDSASTLALGSGLSSDTLDDSTQPVPATPALSSRSSDCSETRLQQYLDEAYADSHRGRSPKERGLCKLEEEADEPPPKIEPTALSTQPLESKVSMASKPEITTDQLPASNPEVTTHQLPASNPEVTTRQHVQITGTIPETADQPLHSKQQENLQAIQQGTMPETTDQPVHSKQQENLEAIQQGTMPGTTDQPVHSKQQENMEASWRCDKYGNESKPAALYARFYRSGRSHALSKLKGLGFRV